MVEHPTAGEGGAISENDKSIKSDKGSTNHVQEVRSGVAGVWFVCSFHGQRSPGAGIKGQSQRLSGRQRGNEAFCIASRSGDCRTGNLPTQEPKPKLERCLNYTKLFRGPSGITVSGAHSRSLIPSVGLEIASVVAILRTPPAFTLDVSASANTSGSPAGSFRFLRYQWAFHHWQTGAFLHSLPFPRPFGQLDPTQIPHGENAAIRQTGRNYVDSSLFPDGF
jgi:hypothetical protein